MGLLMKMAKYSVKIGLGYFAVGTKRVSTPDVIDFVLQVRNSYYYLYIYEFMLSASKTHENQDLNL